MEAVLQQKVIEVANHVEQQLDTELEKLDNLDISDYERIRANRLNELKQMQKQKQDWLASVMHETLNEVLIRTKRRYKSNSICFVIL